MIWRRGKRELSSKAGAIDPVTHDAKIDDMFKMKTAVDFDTDEYKFQSKLSILELVFADSKQSIGYVEFDLGAYSNKIRDQLVKTVLDLKSEKYPGCQIYIYVNIQLLDELPARTSTAATSSSSTARPSTAGSTIDSSVTTIDLNQNLFDIRKAELEKEIIDLQEGKIKLEQEFERLKF